VIKKISEYIERFFSHDFITLAGDIFFVELKSRIPITKQVISSSQPMGIHRNNELQNLLWTFGIDACTTKCPWKQEGLFVKRIIHCVNGLSMVCLYYYFLLSQLHLNSSIFPHWFF
jgi:hypothetical protein